MRIASFVSRFSNQKVLWVITGLCFILSFFLFHWQGQLTRTLEQMKAEYWVDLELSRHKAEHLQVYRSILSTAKLPQEKLLTANNWIQVTQALVADQKLSLQELKPIYEQRKKGERRTNLFLVAECRVADLLSFLYQIAKSENFVYVEQLSVSTSSGGPDLVRAQMVLSQLGG